MTTWHNNMNKKLNKLLLLRCCWAHSQLILNQIKSFSVPVPVLLSFFAAHLLAGWTLAEQWQSTLHTSSEQADDTGPGKFNHWTEQYYCDELSLLGKGWLTFSILCGFSLSDTCTAALAGHSFPSLNPIVEKAVFVCYVTWYERCLIIKGRKQM